jgi:hypothetical protein
LPIPAATRHRHRVLDTPPPQLTERPCDQATGSGDEAGAVERAEVPRSTDGANAAGAASGDGKGKGTDPDD